MRSVLSIHVDAPPDIVFGLVRDVEAWATLLPHYRSVRVLRRSPGGWLLAAYVAMLPVPFGGSLPIPWRSWSSSRPATRELRFRHAGGITDGMEVTWRITPASSGSHVSIEHRFARPLPIPRLAATHRTDDVIPLVVDRLVVRPIAGRTLRAVRAAAESVRPDRAGASAPGRPPAAPGGPATAPGRPATAPGGPATAPGRMAARARRAPGGNSTGPVP